MRCLIGGRYQNIIEVGEHERTVAKHLVHRSLERTGCITQAKWHRHVLKKTKGGSNGSFFNVTITDRNLIVRSDQVYLGKDSTVFEIIVKGLNMGQGITVRDGYFIQSSIISCHSKFTIGLLDQMNR